MSPPANPSFGRRMAFSLVLLLVRSEVAAAEFPAAGIDGALVLSGADTPTPNAVTKFVELAGAPASRVVVIEWLEPMAKPAPATPAPAAPAQDTGAGTAARTLLERWQHRGGTQLTVIRIDAATAPDESALRAVREARGVWLQADRAATLRRQLTASPLAKECDDLRRRGGVVGGTAALAALVADFGPADGKTETAPGLGWLAGFALRPAGEDADDAESPGDAWSRLYQRSPRTIELRLSPGATLVARGRELETLGDDVLTIRFPATAHAVEQSWTLGGKHKLADLTALRRQARERGGEVYPPADPLPPVVPRGTLIIIGGGRTPKAAFEQFVAAAGGPGASIVVLPIATPEPLPARDGMVEALRKAGVSDVTILPQRTPEAIDQAEPLVALRRATGVWFGGGRQWRFMDAYEGTAAERLMRQVLERGGVIAGSSAGASIQGDYLVRGHPLGSQFMMCDGYPRGMAFLPGVAIDQHFTQRRRHDDMRALVRRFPQLLGIGIDESTALVVRGTTAEVVGEHHVHFFDPQPGRAEGPVVATVGNGGSYDLYQRRQK